MTHDPTDLPVFARKALSRLDAADLLIRTSSDTDEAVLKGGGGFLYTVHPGGRKFPTASGKLLIEAGYVTSQGDGLLTEVSQTFVRA